MAAPLGIEPSSKALEAFVLTDELWSYRFPIKGNYFISGVSGVCFSIF